ncbi:putative uncharacterized protein [Staphylococcus equorum subsp. equorum Mu2]|nr:putative uncharacterized protein [Staphylococcus equorum subsp. equorum Mu2]
MTTMMTVMTTATIMMIMKMAMINKLLHKYLNKNSRVVSKFTIPELLCVSSNLKTSNNL